MNHIHYSTQEDGGFLPPFLFVLTSIVPNLRADRVVLARNLSKPLSIGSCGYAIKFVYCYLPHFSIRKAYANQLQVDAILRQLLSQIQSPSLHDLQLKISPQH